MILFAIVVSVALFSWIVPFIIILSSRSSFYTVVASRSVVFMRFDITVTHTSSVAANTIINVWIYTCVVSPVASTVNIVYNRTAEVIIISVVEVV